MKTNQEAKKVEFHAGPVTYRELDRRPPSETRTGVLWAVIPYTTQELTRAALRHAGVCSDLNVHVLLVDIQVVPFHCPVDHPPINKEFSEQRLRDLLDQSDLPGKTEISYARDWFEGFRRVLEPESLVILAAKKHWWRTREEKLAHRLVKAGHQVLLLHI